jgi:hypothetical protein
MASFIGTSELSYLAIFLIVLALSGVLLFQHTDQSVKEVNNVRAKANISGPIPVIIFKLPRTGCHYLFAIT